MDDSGGSDPAWLMVSLIAGGVGLLWLGWRLRLPSILLLLLAGFAISPAGLGWLDPAEAIGQDALFALVSLSVAVILFEGGFTLRTHELRRIHHSLRGLVTIGVLVAWLTGAAAAVVILDFGWPLAMILGAILVVTGPTVIIPLLQHVRPRGRVSAVVRWEGILNDPIGAVLAVLVFEAVLLGATDGVVTSVLWGLGKAAAIGGGLGWLAGFTVAQLMERRWIPDRLHGVVTLAVILLVFIGSNRLQHESGLLTVTVAGAVLANQRRVHIRHVAELLEHLREMLIAVLFLILGARLTTDKLAAIGVPAVLFAVVLILVVRPLAVNAALFGSKLDWRERLFVSWMAPRGIVAVAVASLFGLQLARVEVPGADQLEPVVLLVVMITVGVYGLSARPVCRLLKLAEQHPRGVLILGADDWAVELAAVLHGCNVPVLLVDTNRRKIQHARMRGLRAQQTNLYREGALEQLDLDGIGYLLALTANAEANSLAALRCVEHFGRGHVFQLPSADHDPANAEHELELRGHLLWSEDASWDTLEERWRSGWRLVATSITGEFDLADFRAVHGERSLPLVIVHPEQQLDIVAAGEESKPGPGDTLIALVPD